MSDLRQSSIREQVQARLAYEVSWSEVQVLSRRLRQDIQAEVAFEEPWVDTYWRLQAFYLQASQLRKIIQVNLALEGPYREHPPAIEAIWVRLLQEFILS